MSFYKTTDSIRTSSGEVVSISRSGNAGTPCLVCGSKDGSCNSGDNPQPNIRFVDQAPEDKQMVFVEEDVIVEREIAPNTMTKIRLARKGTYVTKKVAKEIGLLGPDA